MTELLKRSRTRQQLQERIARYPVTLLCGGPGVGKSVLLEELFTRDGFVDEDSCLFIRFTKRDGSIKAYLRRFALVLNLDALPDLQRPAQMASAIQALPEHVIIVIDDLHVLGSRPEYTTYLSELIKLSLHAQQPPRRWVVALRRATELPQLAALPPKHITTFSASGLLQLRDFERDELNDLRGIQQTHRICGTMRSVMLNMAFLIAKEQKLLAHRTEASLAQTRGYLPLRGHRLISKLIRRLQPALQKFLYVTCLLEEIDVRDLLETGDLEPHALHALGQIGILHYDAVLGGLRYDSTVTDYLQATLPYCSTEIVEIATRHAAHAGIRRADVLQGLEILHAHQAWSHSLAILEKYGLDLLDHEPVHGAVATTLQALPMEVVKRSAVAAGLYGVLTARVSFGDIAESWFQNSLALSEINTTFRRQIAFRYAFEIIRRERSDAFDLISPLHAELETNPNLDPELRALARIAMAVVSMQHKQQAQAIAYVQLALEAATFAYDNATHARVYQGAAYVHLRLGSPELAIPLADRAISYSVRDRFDGLAAWCISIRQELALNVEHDLPLTLRYLRQLEFYAWLSEDTRMMLTAAMGMYWIGVELADTALMASAEASINRHDAIDDYMQMQVRLTLIPGAGYLQAWQGNYDKAAELVEFYAPLAHPGHHQAFRWSELALYHAASHACKPDLKVRNKAYMALQAARQQLCQLERPLGHENDVLLRLAIAAILLGKFRLTASLNVLIHDSALVDPRANEFVTALRIFLQYWKYADDPQPMAIALRKLKAQHCGNIARVIGTLPLPPATRHAILRSLA